MIDDQLSFLIIFILYNNLRKEVFAGNSTYYRPLKIECTGGLNMVFFWTIVILFAALTIGTYLLTKPKNNK